MDTATISNNNTAGINNHAMIKVYIGTIFEVHIGAIKLMYNIASTWQPL